MAAHTDDNPLAENFARQVIPFVACGRSPEAVHRVLVTLVLWHGLRHRTWITEDSEVIADFDPLVGPEIYVNGAQFAIDLAKVFSSHDHGHRLAAHRRKVIESRRIFESRRWAFLVRHHDIPALHVIARECHLSDRNLGLNDYHAQLSRVPIGRAHRIHQLRLPLEPEHFCGIFDGSHNREPVAYANTFVLAAIDMHIVAARTCDLVV